MRALLPVLLCLPFLPSQAKAQDVSISAGFAVTSEYVSNGLQQSNGAAVQPYIEVEINGFYAGIWASNVSAAIIGGGDTYEYDLYAGYRNEVGRFSYDIGYAHYFYNNTGACCGEVILSMGVAATDTLSVGGLFKIDPNTSVTNIRGSVDFAPVDKLTFSAGYGTVSNSHNYWSLGGSYAVNDNVSLDLTYHDTTISNGLIVGTVSFDFSLR